MPREFRWDREQLDPCRAKKPAVSVIVVPGSAKKNKRRGENDHDSERGVQHTSPFSGDRFFPSNVREFAQQFRKVVPGESVQVKRREPVVHSFSLVEWVHLKG